MECKKVGLQMECESDNHGLNFDNLGFEYDQKLPLIDISQENDNLLGDSTSFSSLPDFRLSGLPFDDIYENRGCNLLKPQLSQKVENTVVTESASYGRPSLAWDSAFFTNEGVLDNDELTLMNEGFKAAQMQPVTCNDVNTGRFKHGHRTKDDVVSSASRKINTSVPRRTNQSAFARGSMVIPRSHKNKTQVCSPDVSSPMMNRSTGKSRRASSVDAYHVKKQNIPEIMRSVDNLKLRKKSTLGSALRVVPTGSPAESVSSVFRFTSNSTAPSFSHGTKKLPANSSLGSCSGSRSMAKQQSREIKVFPDTSMTPRRAISSHNEVIESLYLMDNIQAESSLHRPQKEGSPGELNYQCTPDTFHALTDSREKYGRSYLRLPSPTIGFFDEGKSGTPTMGGSLHLQFETECVEPNSSSGPGNRKTNKLPRAGMSPGNLFSKLGSRSTQQLHPIPNMGPGQINSDGKLKKSSSKGWITTKTRSDVDSKFQSGVYNEGGEWICSKCRKVGDGILDRKKVDKISVLRQEDEKRVKGRLRREIKGQTDYITRESEKPVKNEHQKRNYGKPGTEDERRMLAKVEDQVNDLSKYFEVIDLGRDIPIENEDDEKASYNGSSSFTGENVVVEQKGPRTFKNQSPSISAMEISPSSRTPLADKTSISNRSGSLQHSAKGKLHTCPEKENSFPCQA